MSKVEDMLAIQQVIAQYSYTFDSRDAAGWVDLFTEDAVWESYRGFEKTPTNRLEGRAAMRTWADGMMVRRAEGSLNYHHQSGILFDELTATTARTRAMAIITAQDSADQPVRINRSGIYRTQWVKTPQGWRIKHCMLGS